MVPSTTPYDLLFLCGRLGTGAPCLVSHHLSGQRLGCRTTDVGGPRQDRPSGAEADRSGV